MANKIEKVSKGSPMGVHAIGAPKSKVVFIVVEYQDNTKRSMTSDGKCVGFTEDSFLVKVKKEWRFYDVDCNLISTKAVAELGECVEVTDKFYLFVKDENYLTVNASGEIAPYPDENWRGLRVADIFRFGITKLKKALENARSNQ